MTEESRLSAVIERDRAAAVADLGTEPASFQARVQLWMMECFGPEIAADITERNHRFLEEALEVVQSLGCTASEAHQLVDYVFGRPAGEPHQEIGGARVTLAALCLAAKIDMHEAGETELARVWTMVEKIRAKQAAKPKHSPLPDRDPAARLREALAAIAGFAKIDMRGRYEHELRDTIQSMTDCATRALGGDNG